MNRKKKKSTTSAPRRRDPIARELELNRYRQRILYNKKGRHPYKREHYTEDEALDELVKQAQELDMGYDD